MDPIMINLKPAADGLLVRLEDGSGYLPAAGQPVPLTAYYRRRIADGDAMEVQPEPAKPARQKAEA
ncbi:DUF2635 domain-containing protein [Chromobacterium sp. ATCC 53434]|uniref:DUF2635 domain-containing protein n=1 Tax=Chromobacterium sp. (strain ATCC 53434 / SC 14030) TaxID=2059672 RepID=UPI000C7624A7|nr:DUF2635 domain-containing protein [Chromobacterium sp. ATCC 53434]AUH51222.1 DUF2635 domain-containing protein [Chromobacterium sp. ATCC 53434]